MKKTAVTTEGAKPRWQREEQGLSPRKKRVFYVSLVVLLLAYLGLTVFFRMQFFQATYKGHRLWVQQSDTVHVLMQDEEGEVLCCDVNQMQFSTVGRYTLNYRGESILFEPTLDGELYFRFSDGSERFFDPAEYVVSGIPTNTLTDAQLEDHLLIERMRMISQNPSTAMQYVIDVLIGLCLICGIVMLFKPYSIWRMRNAGGEESIHPSNGLLRAIELAGAVLALAACLSRFLIV